MRDVLPTLERWLDGGRRVATATVVATERSTPRDPGAVLAVNERGEVAGSVTGGCVEPAVYEEAQQVLSGGAPRLRRYGIAEETAFEVGLPCGGSVEIFVDVLERGPVDALVRALEDERPAALVTSLSGREAGRKRVVYGDEADGGEVGEVARRLLAADESSIVRIDDAELFVLSFAPRPNMYVFGAIDHAAAVAEVGRFLGYRVTVCDARATFVTRERFPNVDELVVDWPDHFLAAAPVDERAAICVLTHDHRFDVPLLKVALRTPAGYIGAMGAHRTNAERAERLREEGIADEQLQRVHAPIGLPIGSRMPEEVAVAVAAEIVAVMRGRKARVREDVVVA